MQENIFFLPMIKDYIREKMPNGGYQIVSKRLDSKGIKATGTTVIIEVRTLKNKNKLEIITECVLFLKENKITLNNYCEDFIRKEDNK